MKITKSNSIKEDWDNVKSWNYKLIDTGEKYQSVVYAELNGIHGEVNTKSIERVYYILSGKGEFKIENELTPVETGDVITIPPNTKYDYWPTSDETLKLILFMELWEN